MQIVIFRPNNGRGVDIGDETPPLPAEGADLIYNYHNLPEKHQTKYIYAARFVDLVKAVTPKVTFYSDRAKCMLMENVPPNFEVAFYAGMPKLIPIDQCNNIFKMLGGKLLKSSNGWKLTSQDELAISVQEEYLDVLSPSQLVLWNHALQCLRHCEQLEQSLRVVGTNGMRCFPTVIGKRPASSNALRNNKESNRENITPPSKVITKNTCLFDSL
jgi:polo-like kinase 4